MCYPARYLDIEEDIMNLHERLKGLIGHEVIVTTRIADEEKDVPGGVLEEVGADYLMIKTEMRKREGLL